jgi:hypothetical protein
MQSGAVRHEGTKLPVGAALATPLRCAKRATFSPTIRRFRANCLSLCVAPTLSAVASRVHR